MAGVETNPRREAIGEFTADLISEGTREGLAAARARGRVGGRPTVMTQRPNGEFVLEDVEPRKSER